jgi:PAS domain S-box-containing protein
MQTETRIRRGGSLLPCRFAPGLGSIGLAVAVGIAYFLGAHLGLALLTQPDGVAVFWPAAGISGGMLVALGPRARWPVAAGVMAATVLANLLSDRNLEASLVFVLCNTGEPILFAWIINRHFGSRFNLGRVRNVVGLFGAAAVASAVSGIGGTIGFLLFHHSGTSFLSTWLNWFASAALGLITVSPLIIGLANLRHDRRTKLEVSEGLLALTVIALLSVACFASDRDYWFTILPSALFAPILLVLVARCQPVFAAAATFILALAIVCTVTFAVGRLGDPSIALVNRVYAAQAGLLAVAVCTLVLAALFAERRDHVESLTNRNHRLQLALDCAELGTWSLHLKSGRFENDGRDRHIHGYAPDVPQQSLAQMRSQVHPQDLCKLDGAFAGWESAGGRCRTEYRLAPRLDHERDGEERWVVMEGAIVRDAAGRPVQLLGVTRDITETRHAAAKLQESEQALRDLLGALPAAIYVTDASGRITYCNEAATNLWGASPKLGQDRWSDLARFYHLDGTPMALEDCPTAIALSQGRVVRGKEAILERGDGTRVPVIPYPTPLRDRRGNVVGVVNMTVDISERKQAEQALADRNLQLGLAGRFALVGTYAYDVGSEKYQVSPGYAAIHDLADGTEETNRAEWRVRVHPSDLPVVEAGFAQAIAERRREYYCEYRFLRPDGQIRWIDSRNFIFYGHDGAAPRLVGANIDVTERKITEAALKDHKASLADALVAGKVMAFEWDAVTRQTRRSDNAAGILGDDEDGLIGSSKKFIGRIHPDDLEAFKSQMRELSSGNPSYALTFRFGCRDGRQVWLEETARAEFDDTGELLRIKGLTRDITQRKKAELALGERTVQLALAGKAALVGSYAYDTDTEIMQISEGYVVLHGFPEGTIEIRRDECLASVHPEDLARVEQLRDEAFRARRHEYSLEYRIVRAGGEVRWIETRCFITYNGDRHPHRVIGVSIDITERKRVEEQQRVLVAELDHRVKNVLATVSAIVTQTQDPRNSLGDFVTSLGNRIKSLARTHELLSQNHWRDVSLADVARRELAPYAADNVEIGGPRVTLRAEAAQVMAMVLHELATNAAKHGAFSDRNGHVSLRWRWLRNGSRGRLAIEWQEIGGPQVLAPAQHGYGASVIREIIPFELGGTVELAFPKQGVKCRMEIPAEWISTKAVDFESRQNIRHGASHM